MRTERVEGFSFRAFEGLGFLGLVRSPWSFASFEIWARASGLQSGEFAALGLGFWVAGAFGGSANGLTGFPTLSTVAIKLEARVCRLPHVDRMVGMLSSVSVVEQLRGPSKLRHLGHK